MGETLTVEEVAEELRMRPQGVRRMIRDGRIRAVRVGKRYLVKREELARILSDGTEPVTLAGGRVFPRKDN